jgi:hypothetical protein
VSAAPVERNPAKRFLREHGFLSGAFSHASSGRPGAVVLSNLRGSQLDQASAVIAVDLMFWDSVMGLADPRESRAFLRGFFKELAKRDLPIIIGNVPAIHPLQIHRDELNEAIEREVANHPRAALLSLDQLFATVIENAGIEIDGKHHSLMDLIPDGLHPGPVASAYVAKEISSLAGSISRMRGSA